MNLKKTVTFGSIPGRYDVVVRPGDTNKVVQELKRQYEPVTLRLQNMWYNEKNRGKTF